MKILKRVGKILGWFVAILVVVVLVILVALPPVAVKVVNAKAGDFVNAKVSLQNIDLNLFRGTVAIDGLRIGQPEGFEGDPLLDLRHAHVKLRVGSLLHPPIVISDVVVEQLSANILRNADGVMNVEKLVKAPAEAKPIEPDKEPSAAQPPAVALNHLLINNVKVRYIDTSFGGDALDMGVSNLVLRVTDILFDPSVQSDSTLPGRVELTSRVTQGKAADAFLGVIARVGVLSTNVPAVNAGVRLSGLELKGVAPALPSGVAPSLAAVLGGSCMDLEVDASISPETRNIKATLVNKTARLELPTGGGFDNIMSDLAKLLTARLAGQVGSLAGNVGSAGVSVVGTAADSALSVGKGAGKLVGNVGGGLLKMVSSAAKGDVKSVGAALKDTTVGSVKDAVSTVTNTAATAVSGMGEAAGKGLGTDSTDQWRKDSEGRWAQAWATTLTRVDNLPYPTALKPQPAATTNRITNTAEEP